MISMPADSFTDWVMVRHNTQTFEHLLTLHFIQVQIINMPFSYIRLKMICLVILSFKNSIIFRKEKVIIIAGSRLQVNRKSGLHFRKNKAWPACETEQSITPACLGTFPVKREQWGKTMRYFLFFSVELVDQTLSHLLGHCYYYWKQRFFKCMGKYIQDGRL